MFVKDINALFCAAEVDNSKQDPNPNHFRVAIIKADLDGMGDMFKKIAEYKDYHIISEVLKKRISLDGLHKAAEANRPSDRDDWLFPFYVAGDDIFFAVSVVNLARGIDVCKKLLMDVNNALTDAGISTKLSISIGVDITFNRQPIRYYLDMVEGQLKHAKDAICPIELNKFLDAKIAIGGLTYFDVDNSKVKIYKQTLKCLRHKSCNTNPKYKCNNCSNVNSEQSECRGLIGTPSFFYTLLERLTDETVRNNNTKYINNLPFHLLPKYLDSPIEQRWKSELILNAGIINQLYKKRDKGSVIELCDETKHRLETYLRLMILFSDTRFKSFKDKKTNSNLLNEDRLKHAKKVLLTKIPPHLYQNELRGSLRKFFIIKDKFTKSTVQDGAPTSEEDTIIPYYRMLRIEKSMFFKLRETEKISIERAAAMLSLNNSKTEIDMDLETSIDDLKTKPVYHMPFKEKEFCQKARARSEWNPDYLDSMMLFYEYQNDYPVQFNCITSGQCGIL